MNINFKSALTDEQLTQYETDGYLLVSGLMSDDIAEKAEAAMWDLMEMNRDDPQTWTEVPSDAEYEEKRGVVIFNGVTDPDLLACATPEYLLAVAQLIGEDVETLHPPQAIHTQNLLPMEMQRPTPHAHVDGIPREHMHPTFPGPYRIASLVYLSDIAPNGGGTVVWPGSKQKISALAESDPEKYKYLFDLNKDIPTLDLGEPIELTPKRGDVLFFQHLFGHNGTPNTGARPRLMMRYFCACDACGRWKKTDEWNHWTP